MADMRVMATGLEFPEGPVAMADGSVILGEIKGKRVTRIAPDGSKSTIGSAGGGPNGLARGPDGRLIAVLSIDVADGQIQTVRSVISRPKLRHLGPLADLAELLQRGDRPTAG